MNHFLEGFLSELSKEALLIPKGGLALGKQTVMKARNIPRSGDVHPGSARRELDMPKRPPAKPQAGGLPDAPAGRFMAVKRALLEKEAIDPASMALGASIIPLLRRLAAMGSAAKATKIVEALESKGLPTASLPFSVRHPHLSAMFAPGTLEKRVTEVETSAREYADRSMSRSMSREIHEALK